MHISDLLIYEKGNENEIVHIRKGLYMLCGLHNPCHIDRIPYKFIWIQTLIFRSFEDDNSE